MAARSEQTELLLRIVIDQPVAGVVYSLQNKKSEPVAPALSSGADLVFEAPVRVGPGPRFFGDFIRSEGKQRQFIYVASGKQAGQAASRWSRRMKIDVHAIPQAVIDAALKGASLLIVVPGADRDGGPACATVKPLEDWQAV
jgi:hypothetical protein